MPRVSSDDRILEDALGLAAGTALVLDRELRVRLATPGVSNLLGFDVPLGASAPKLLCGQALKRPLAEALAEGLPVQALLHRPTTGTGARALRVRSIPITRDGVFNGAGVNAVRESNRTPALAARVVWNLHGLPIDGEVDFDGSAPRVAVGASAMTTSRPVNASVSDVQVREDLGGVEVAFRAHGFDVTAEAMARTRTVEGRRDRVVGGYIRADQYIPAWKASLGARAVRIHGVDDAAVSRTEVELDGGIYPAQHDLKLVMNFGRARLHAARAWDTYLMVQVQAGF